MSQEKRILLCEDDRFIGEVTKRILEEEGYEVHWIETLDDNFLSLVNTIEPRLVLMDLQMPHLGGEKAIRRMQKNQLVSETPVLVFSCRPNAIQIAHKLDVGVVQKPYERAHLVDSVNEHCA